MAKDNAINDIKEKASDAKVCLHCWDMGEYFVCGFYPVSVENQFKKKCTPADWAECPFK
jgi:hypothetical protein